LIKKRLKIGYHSYAEQIFWQGIDKFSATKGKDAMGGRMGSPRVFVGEKNPV